MIKNRLHECIEQDAILLSLLYKNEKLYPFLWQQQIGRWWYIWHCYVVPICINTFLSALITEFVLTEMIIFSELYLCNQSSITNNITRRTSHSIFSFYYGTTFNKKLIFHIFKIKNLLSLRTTVAIWYRKAYSMCSTILIYNLIFISFDLRSEWNFVLINLYII